MKQKRLQAGLTLIQRLLTCPEGEEWILLKQNETLVDAEFVQLMEQVAAQLFREGDRQAAKFLHNWAAQLHHILIKEVEPPKADSDQSEAYLQLIQALIDCPEGEESGLLSQHSDLIGPGLVAMMHQVAEKMAHKGIIETAQFLENLATQINQSWIQSHVLPQRSRMVPTRDASLFANSPLYRSSQIQSPQAKFPTQSPQGKSPQRKPASTESRQIQSQPTNPSHAESTPVALNQDESTHSGSENPRSAPSGSIQSDLPQSGAPQSGAPQSASLSSRNIQSAEPIPDPWESTPLSSALKLKVPQQLANGLHDVALLLHQIDKTLVAQTQVLQALAERVQSPPDAASTSAHGEPKNPLWYMEVLEQACDRGWILTTEEVEQLIGVKPKCHGDEASYQRGCWVFKKSGKLGPQTAWRVHKAEG